MESVKVTKKDHVHLRISASPSVLQEISDFFTFEVPGAKFTPSYKFKQWDGKIRLLHMFSGELYLGLHKQLKEFCQTRGYVYSSVGIEDSTSSVTPKELKVFMNGLSLCAHGTDIEIRAYQIEAMLEAINRKRVLMLSPTASGKSLILYGLVRWYQPQVRQQLIIVPNTSLVEQMYTDFQEYSTKNGWNGKTECACIYSGKEKVFSAPVVISTWQSLFRKPKAFFERFDVIYGDEAHLYTAKSLTGIFHKTTNTPYKIGTTGTLNGTKCHEMVLEGLFGPVYKVTTTKQLMDDNYLADLFIHCLVLEYSPAEKKAAAKKTFRYADEMQFLVAHPARNAFIKQLALNQEGNTLLLFQFVKKHGTLLYGMIREAVRDERKVFFVHGEIDAEDRERIREIVEHETNAIIIASVGVFSQGVNIRNLHNIILASPSKSRIRNLQSIGRGLRTADDKIRCTLFDIADDLSWKSHSNHTLLHFIERVKIYAEEVFRYKLRTLRLF